MNKGQAQGTKSQLDLVVFVAFLVRCREEGGKRRTATATVSRRRPTPFWTPQRPLQPPPPLGSTLARGEGGVRSRSPWTQAGGEAQEDILSLATGSAGTGVRSSCLCGLGPEAARWESGPRLDVPL